MFERQRRSKREIRNMYDQCNQTTYKYYEEKKFINKIYTTSNSNNSNKPHKEKTKLNHKKPKPQRPTSVFLLLFYSITFVHKIVCCACEFFFLCCMHYYLYCTLHQIPYVCLRRHYICSPSLYVDSPRETKLHEKHFYTLFCVLWRFAFLLHQNNFVHNIRTVTQCMRRVHLACIFYTAHRRDSTSGQR